MTESSPFRITRVRLRDYRNIASCDVRLGALTFLVGPNGSGKSNFLDALSLLADAQRMPLVDALRNHRGVELAVRRNVGRDFSLDVEFAETGLHGRYRFTVVLDVDSPQGLRVHREECEVSADGRPPVRFSVEQGELRASTDPIAVHPDRPGPSGWLALPFAANLDPSFDRVRNGLASFAVLNPSPDAIRPPHTSDRGDILLRNGENLAAAFEHLHRSAPQRAERVLDYLRLILPGLDQVHHSKVGEYDMLRFVLVAEGGREETDLPAEAMSDGTLRVLAVLVGLFSGPASFSGPIGVEDPETGVYAAEAAVLRAAIGEASEWRQVLVTSHSPDLLDDREIRADQIIAFEVVDGTALVGPVADHVRMALADKLYTAGELLGIGQIYPPHDGLGRSA